MSQVADQSRAGQQEPLTVCHQFPMRGGFYMAQVVLPRVFSKDEADRLCAFIQSLVKPAF